MELYTHESEEGGEREFCAMGSKLARPASRAIQGTAEKLRRANSMNDATKPSDAIDDALRLFNNIEEKENL